MLDDKNHLHFDKYDFSSLYVFLYFCVFKLKCWNISISIRRIAATSSFDHLHIRFSSVERIIAMVRRLFNFGVYVRWAKRATRRSLKSYLPEKLNVLVRSFCTWNFPQSILFYSEISTSRKILPLEKPWRTQYLPQCEVITWRENSKFFFRISVTW